MKTPHTQESKTLISLKTKGREKTLETRKKMSIAQLGNTKALGKKLSEATKIKMSIAKKGSKWTEEAKKRWSEKQKGKIISEQTKKRMSIAGTGRLFTQEHRKKLGEVRKGEKSHFWKGGVTEINKKIRSSLEYRFWREAVFQRDNWTCVFCLVKGGRLNADHIKPFSLFPELRFAIDNGRTLCHQCHKTTDTYGRKIL